MFEPKASHPQWPDAVQDVSKDLSALKPWPWALERLVKSHNYWISTTRPDRRPPCLGNLVAGCFLVQHRCAHAQSKKYGRGSSRCHQH